MIDVPFDPISYTEAKKAKFTAEKVREEHERKIKEYERKIREYKEKIESLEKTIEKYKKLSWIRFIVGLILGGIISNISKIIYYLKKII